MNENELKYIKWMKIYQNCMKKITIKKLIDKKLNF